MNINKEILQTALLIMMTASLVYSAYNHGKTEANMECLVKTEKVNEDLSKIQAEYEVWKKYLVN